jgi:hypothetical protein
MREEGHLLPAGEGVSWNGNIPGPGLYHTLVSNSPGSHRQHTYRFSIAGERAGPVGIVYRDSMQCAVWAGTRDLPDRVANLYDYGYAPAERGQGNSRGASSVCSVRGTVPHPDFRGYLSRHLNFLFAATLVVKKGRIC